MKELITEQQAHQIVIALCVLVSLGSLSWALWESRRKAGKGPRLAWGYGIAGTLLGPLIFLLWTVYNAIENHYGLDSVKALLINLGLFLLTGILAVLVFRQIPSWVSPDRSARKR